MAKSLELVIVGVRSKMDDSDNSPGWKFAEYEMKGVPYEEESRNSIKE